MDRTMGIPKPRTRRIRTPRPGGVRWARIKAIREQIARGTYDTPEKWECLLDRLLTDLDARPAPRPSRRVH